MVFNTCHLPETLNLHDSPEGNCYDLPHFADEETESVNLPESVPNCRTAEPFSPTGERGRGGTENSL